jgi:uncharacterized protein YcbK (DUF882 family)
MKIKCFLTLVILILPASFAISSVDQSTPFDTAGDGTVSLFNTHTSEFETIKYRNADGTYNIDGINRINNFLRCRLTGKEAAIDLKLVELVDHIQDHFRADVIEVVSGYRSPELNGMLRRQSRKVASRSLHMEGLAMDLRIKGVPLREIQSFAKSLHAGGVGYYAGKFVHVDVGSVRYW